MNINPQAVSCAETDGGTFNSEPGFTNAVLENRKGVPEIRPRPGTGLFWEKQVNQSLPAVGFGRYSQVYQKRGNLATC